MANNMLQLKVPKIKRDNLSLVAGHIKALTKRMKNSGEVSSRRYRLEGRGRAIFYVKHPREQRVVVKISYTNNKPSRSWAAHGKYLQREHAQTKNQKGYGFNENSEKIDISSTLNNWQGSGDPRLFKIILSPENADQLDLKEHARELLRRIAVDLGTSLQWIAIDHNDTEHGHLHILVRGIDEHGAPLEIEPEYISEGFRYQSQELVTRKLGLRSVRDISLAREKQIEKSYYTGIDKTIRIKAINNTISFEGRIPKSLLKQERRKQEIKRLKFLESLGLAEQIGKKKWRLSVDYEKTLKAIQLSNDIIKSYKNHSINFSNLHAAMLPTIIDTDKPLTGKIVGMGLDNELYDRRYIILEGVDDKIHYIRAGESIVKTRDAYKLKNGTIITLRAANFINSAGESILYTQVSNHLNLQNINDLKTYHLDDEVVNFVKTNEKFPEAKLIYNSEFAKNYAEALMKRCKELRKSGLFEHQGDIVKLVPGYQARLDDIQHHRFGGFQRWKAVLDVLTKDPTVVGTVLASNERKFLVVDIKGQHYQFNTIDMPISKPPKVGAEVYISSDRIRDLNVSSPALNQEIPDKSCHYSVLKQDRLKLDVSKYVLLDRLLQEVGLPAVGKDSDISKLLNKRAELWSLRGIVIDEKFEREAKRWLANSLTLTKVQERTNKKIIMVKNEEQKTYKGKVVSIGSYDLHEIPHLVIETKNKLYALPMKMNELNKFKLNQEVTIDSSPYQDNDVKLQKKPQSLTKGIEF